MVIFVFIRFDLDLLNNTNKDSGIVNANVICMPVEVRKTTVM